MMAESISMTGQEASKEMLSFLDHAIQRTVERTAGEVNEKIVGEILIAQKEGTPTSRLTSLMMEVKKLLTHSTEEDKDK